MNFPIFSAEQHFNEQLYLYNSVYLFFSKMKKQRMVQPLLYTLSWVPLALLHSLIFKSPRMKQAIYEIYPNSTKYDRDGQSFNNSAHIIIIFARSILILS